MYEPLLSRLKKFERSDFFHDFSFFDFLLKSYALPRKKRYENVIFINFYIRRIMSKFRIALY